MAGIKGRTMTDKITVRELVPQESSADKAALLPAFLDIWNTAENLKYLSISLKPFDEKLVSAWLAGHKETGGHYFCAVDPDNHILGIAVIKISPVEGFEIYGFGVRPEFKRRGIGRRLMEYTIIHAAKLGFKAVNISVFADNTAMLTASLSMGFVPVGMAYNKRADGADVVHMKRYLL